MTEPTAAEPVTRVESLVERAMVSSRWILVVFYGGLAVALLAYAVHFVIKLAKTMMTAVTATANDMLLAMLSLVDATLVASLTVMVMLSGYENFVSRLRMDERGEHLAWLGKLDTGSIKIKMATAIVAISAIHMLQVFLNFEKFEAEKIWQVMAMHLVFVISALLLGVLDRITTGTKGQ